MNSYDMKYMGLEHYELASAVKQHVPYRSLYVPYRMDKNQNGKKGPFFTLPDSEVEQELFSTNSTRKCNIFFFHFDFCPYGTVRTVNDRVHAVSLLSSSTYLIHRE